jgi:serine/threonine protein kinase
MDPYLQTFCREHLNIKLGDKIKDTPGKQVYFGTSDSEEVVFKTHALCGLKHPVASQTPDYLSLSVKYDPEYYCLLSFVREGNRYTFSLDDNDFKDSKIVPDSMREKEALQLCENVEGVPSLLSSGYLIGNNVFSLYSLYPKIGNDNIKKTLDKVFLENRLDNLLPLQKRFRIISELIDIQKKLSVRKISHNDISPRNILLGEQDKVYLTDFAFADFFKEMENPFFTSGQKGWWYGTPAYSSPERMHKNRDVFSVGIIAYELLLGFNPLLTFYNPIRIKRYAPLYRPRHQDFLIKYFREVTRTTTKDPESGYFSLNNDDLKIIFKEDFTHRFLAAVGEAIEIDPDKRNLSKLEQLAKEMSQ